MPGTIGIPIPHELVLLLAGYFASIGILNLFWVILICILASLLSDNISFWIGKKKGVQILRSNLAQRIYFTPKRLKKIENYFHIHGGKTILLTRFMLGFRGLSFIFAGSSNMRWGTFQKYNLIGTIIWIPFVIIVGYLFSWTIILFWKYSSYIKYIMIPLVIVIIGGYLFVRNFRKKNKIKISSEEIEFEESLNY